MRMVRRRGLLAPLLAALLAGAAARAEVPLLEIARGPGFGPAERASVERFLRLNTPRVLATGPGGAMGWQAGGPPELVEERALEICRRRAGGRACQVAVRDLSVVLPNRGWTPPEPPPGMRFGSARHETVPDPRFLWWGPEAAKGVVVFAHGRAPGGADSRGNQPQSWTRRFNNAGWDVWRFDRDPATDSAARADAWLRADLPALRGLGYRRIVLAGQSRGAWNALMTLDQPGLAEVVIAIAPAAHGRAGTPNHPRQIEELRGLLAAATAREARVAVANFRDDAYDSDPEARSALFRGLAGRVGALLFLDRPEGVAGHGAGASTAFNDRFGGCLLRFATAEQAIAECGQTP